MKINILKKWLLALGGTALLFTSCEKTNEGPNITANNLKGMFVVCEGSFNQANGDVTFYNPDSAQSIKNLYYKANGAALGDIVQAFEIVDTLGFIAVNNSQKVTVVNMKTFKVIKNISGFSYPRSVVRADKNSVYVSNGNGYSKNYIYKIDLTSLKKVDSLAVATGPEKLIVVNTKVYAAIAGGWKNDGKAVVEIDPSTFKITNTFTVAPVPIDIVADKDNNIWAYCKGVASYDANYNATYSNMGISKINVSTKVVNTFPLTTMSASGTNNIAVSNDGNTIYYVNDGLFAMPVNATALPTTKLVNQLFYGLDVDPQSGNIICLDAVNSKAIGYNVNGTEQFSFQTATYPNSVVFSY
ncbi:MAG: hypothetical protein Q8928_04545 [Bacteroidota bacterium]|nr:hypothetical protein [Bacteroidota bacterium]